MSLLDVWKMNGSGRGNGRGKGPVAERPVGPEQGVQKGDWLEMIWREGRITQDLVGHFRASVLFFYLFV